MNFIILKEAQECLGLTWGTPQGHKRVPPAGETLAAAKGRLCPLEGPTRWAASHIPSLSRKITPTLLKHEFLPLSAGIFDLFVQPIILAEIWSKSSPVCDSFTPPIRILNGFV